MQPIDEQLCRDLVAQLIAITGNRIKNIEFTWDAYHRSDFEQDEVLYVTPNRVTHSLSTRNTWVRSSLVNFVFIAPAIVNSQNQDEVVPWIYSWDELVEDIKQVRPLGRSLLEFEQEERFSITELQQRARLMFEAIGTYNLKV